MTRPSYKWSRDLSAITAEYWRDRVVLDHSTGVFTWKPVPVATKTDKAWNTQWAGKPVTVRTIRDPWTAGRDQNLIRVRGKYYGAARLVWLFVHGEWPTSEVDHINRNASDNRPENLRLASHSQNQMNKGPMKNNRLGIKGVGFSESRPARKKFYAQIKIPGTNKTKHLGWFFTAEEASKKYEEVASALHGEFFFKHVNSAVVTTPHS